MAQDGLTIRPKLTKNLNADTFKNFYWMKKELVDFCRQESLPYNGGKIELTDRIENYLRNGKIVESKVNSRVGPWDSENPFTRSTIVVNYKNDVATREFLKSKIGPSFHVNAYLRQLSKSTNKDKTLTYGGVIETYKKEESKKNNPNYKSTIQKQFQFNQFQRDFYANERGKSRQEFLAAWRLVRTLPGEASYKHYLELKSKNKEGNHEFEKSPSSPSDSDEPTRPAKRMRRSNSKFIN